MKLLVRLEKWFHGLHRLSKLAIKMGFWLMVCFYIIALYARYAALSVPDYFYAMSVYRGGLEAAPASFAAGIIAGVLGDLMLRRGRSGGE